LKLNVEKMFVTPGNSKSSPYTVGETADFAAINSNLSLGSNIVL